jgi:lipopolysaccharide export system protein LptA
MTRRQIALALAVAAFTMASDVFALKADAEQPINIRARSVEANEKTGVSVYNGNVIATQGSLRLEADRVEVTLRDGRTDLIRAWGQPVRLQTRTDNGEEIKARAARAVYRASTRRIELNGNVELKRDNDVLTGAVVRYGLDDQTFSAQGNGDGQVSAVVQPAKPESAR